MNRITHKIALWRIDQMMARSCKLDAKMILLAEKIGKYEKPRFHVNAKITKKP